MVEELVTISARVRKSQAEEIERLAIKRGLDKSAILRQLLTIALREQKFREALEMVRTRKVTVWKAAEVAGITYREMLQLLRNHNVPFPLSEEELRHEVEEIIGRKQRGPAHTPR